MTERKPTGQDFESWVDKLVREATERGEFDDLPGRGKPLPGAGERYDEMWWVRDYARREGVSADALLPAGMRLRKEVERLPDAVRELRSERDVRETVAELNRRIADWLRAPSGPWVPLRPVPVEDVVQRWRADRALPATPPPEEPPRQQQAPQRRPRWWHRFTGRR